MKKSQSGFTLVELVVVIVLLGILGVTALGKFQDLSGDAADAAVKGIAAELSSASAINFAARTVNSSNGTAIGAANCIAAVGVPSSTLDSLMASGSAPTANLTYSLVTAAASGGDILVEDAACASGLTFKCSINDSRGSTAATTSILCTG
jgi:prepilin-type N-terminal cleavage/methylation domain-containing protein